MEEPNQQTSETDLDLITKDCDRHESNEDTSDSGRESQLCAENTGEDDMLDSKIVTEPLAVSSNGIDNFEQAVDENAIFSDNILHSTSSASSAEASLSNVFYTEYGQETIDHQLSSEATSEVSASDKESNDVVSENTEQSKCSEREESEKEKNCLVPDGEDYVRSLTGDNEKKHLELGSVHENDQNTQLDYDKVSNANDGEISRRDSDNSENIKIMPYKEKDDWVNDVQMSDSYSNNDDSVGKFNIIDSKPISVEKSQDSFNKEQTAGVDSSCSTELSKSSINEEIKEFSGNLSDSSKFLLPVDIDEAGDNVADEQMPEVGENQLSTNIGSSYKETDDMETDTTESQMKDGFSIKVDTTREGNLDFSPTNACMSLTDDSETSKNDLNNEGSEILSTEIVNCNDEIQMEISENEKETEVNNIDTDPCEDTDKKQDGGGVEGMEIDQSGSTEPFNKVLDKKEESCNIKDQFLADMTEAEKQIISVDESEALVNPGESEEETITGDTTSEVQINDSRGKDAEICIIPDDVTPRLSVHTEKDKMDCKEIKSVVGTIEGEEEKTLKVTSLEMEKDKETAEEKSEGDGNEKGRPVRVAAKLAGSKIKSLIQTDSAPETLPSVETNSGEDVKCGETRNTCVQCAQVKSCKFEVIQGGRTNTLCSDQCYNAFVKGSQPEVVDVEPGSQRRKCSQCHLQVAGDENTLSWETMDFCNEECLGKYQTELGSNCANCKGSVASVSLGKYCVRFGYDVKQFCTSACLEEYKKGLKVCSYCQKDISTGTEGFLAPVGDKGHFKDFCTQSCMEKYEQMSNSVPPPNVVAECAVCSNSKPVKVEVQLEDKTQKLCSEPCFAAFKFVNNITEGQCDMCRKYFDRLKTGSFSIYYDDSPHTFCGKTCMNVYILANRKIVPCNWCKVKKYNFDMIKKVSVTGQILMMCSLNCLALYQVSINAVTSRRIRCDFCMTFAQAQYHLTMSDATVRNFCGYSCVMSFQNRYPKHALSLPSTERLTSPIPTGGPKKILPRRSQVGASGVPVISSVQSLASPNGPVTGTRVSIPASEVSLVPQVASISQPITIQSSVPTISTPPAPQVYQQIITKPAPVKQQKNKSVLCKPYSHTKGVSCRPHPCMKETQTDESLNRKFLIPVPVPIYVPAPMHMFATPFPVPVPFPLPVPVPIFIPTTRNSAKGIFKEIKKIQEKIPTDPFEAELLMMAEMVAGEKKQDPTDSESDDGNDGDDGGDGTFSPENVDTSNTFGEDMLQMALKMATELEEPAVDMESVLTSNTITPTSQPTVDPNKGLYGSSHLDDPDQVQVMPMNRGRKRTIRGGRNSAGGSQSKRGRRISGSNVDVPILPPPEAVPPPRIEVEKPDANMCLKYTFGVNAWRHWVMQKNAELEKAALTNRKIKLFKPELLQLTADELNFSLCLFVKEVRKPNGAEYAPDTIYYLCLGIQQYLFENGRIDNIFTDSYYEKFTDCLDEVAKKFAALYSDSQYIVTRVEEEHLWESKQLGAHSPHVLLSTLMFFNTKHFNLVTVEEHMQLSFSHIMKHWKRNPNAPGVAKVPGSRNVLLRFYPPQSALEANSRKKKVYEQQENEENPLRCPVKLYEFYLSKCPESVKTRNDVFYLLPERSCVPDSPVWYSTMALGKEPLTKMLHRVKMVKEINIALLTC